MRPEKIERIRFFDRSISLPLFDCCHTKSVILMKSTVLFSRNGFNAVSMRDIAGNLDITQASLYNHYDSKEELVKMVLNHARDLYLLYCSSLSDTLENIRSLDKMLDLVLSGSRNSGEFALCSFSLIQSEQIYNEQAGAIYNEIFVQYTANLYKKFLDRLVETGKAQPFDTASAAFLLVETVLLCNLLAHHEKLGRKAPLSSTSAAGRMKEFLLTSAAC